MGEENIRVGQSPVLSPDNFRIFRAFNLSTGEWVARIRIRDDRGQELAFILNHEAYHELTRFVAEYDHDVYNHKD